MKLFVLLIMIVGVLFASVDMNNADAKAFKHLKGVGPKKAEAIVAYRKIHGCFTSIDGLILVKGIGKKTLQKNRTDLVLGKCKKD